MTLKLEGVLMTSRPIKLLLIASVAVRNRSRIFCPLNRALRPLNGNGIARCSTGWIVIQWLASLNFVLPKPSGHHLFYYCLIPVVQHGTQTYSSNYSRIVDSLFYRIT